MIKYFVKTYNNLPCTKWIWDNLDDLKKLLNKIIDKKPYHLSFDKNIDLDGSLEIVKIDTELLPEYNDIFKTKTNIDWKEVEYVGSRKHTKDSCI